jgi:Uma2 family endonuclease
MATISNSTTSRTVDHELDLDQRIELNGVSWETYRALLRTREAQRGSVRMMYDQGRLVLMSPSPSHDVSGERLGLIVRLTAAGLGLNCMGVGRTTLTSKKARRGKEPDTAFYLANEPRVRGKISKLERLDLKVYPPPDLAIEVEYMHHDRGMLDVYESLGVPEVWHFDGEKLRALRLRSGEGYSEVAASPALPLLPLGEIPGWLERFDTEGESVTIVAFLEWVRTELAPPAARAENLA